jgi:hypothetical protein
MLYWFLTWLDTKGAFKINEERKELIMGFRVKALDNNAVMDVYSRNLTMDLPEVKSIL